MTGLLLYTTENGRNWIQLRSDKQTVWLTHLELAVLFGATTQNISRHLNIIYEDRELDSAATVKESLTTAEESSVVRTEGTHLTQALRPMTGQKT